MEGLFLEGDIICMDFLQNTLKFYDINCKNRSSSHAICKLLYTDIYTYECAVSIPILKIAFLKHVLSKVRFLFH